MRGVYQGFTTNDEGQVITGATVEVRLPGGSLATIYSVQTGGTAIANPIAVDANGYFRFYADPGLYSVGAFIGATQLADFDDVEIVGSMAIQNADAVAITGGSVAGITDLAIADGGTGASTATGARTNLGLGTAAVVNTGPGLTQVPTGQDLADGVALEGLVSNFSGSRWRNIPVAQALVDGVTVDGIIVLVREETGTRSGAAGRIVVTSNTGSGNGLTANIDFSAHARVAQTFCDLTFRSVWNGSFDKIPEATPVTFTIDGVWHAGIRLANWSATLVNYAAASFLFDGVEYLNGGTSPIQVIDTPSVSNLSVRTATSHHIGAPGDSIGANTSLHISGSPNTSKEVMVDGSGFIVEV